MCVDSKQVWFIMDNSVDRLADYIHPIGTTNTSFPKPHHLKSPLPLGLARLNLALFRILAALPGSVTLG